MSHFKISSFGRIIDHSIGVFLVSLGAILAGATAIVGA
jgi:hypothetical protein